MRRFALFFIASFLLTIPAHAQDGYPLPAELPTITPENAAHLTELASIGGTLPGGLAWSPDGVHLAVGTSENVQVFDSTNLNTAPTIIPAPDIYRNLYFDSQGHLSFNTNGQGKWDIQTGTLIPPTQPTTSQSFSETRPYLSPDGKIEAIPDFQNEQIMIHLVDTETIPAKKLADLKTGLDADFSGMFFSPDGQKLALYANMHNDDIVDYPAPAIQLWDVSRGELLYTWQIPYGQIAALDFSDDSRFLIGVEADPEWEGLIAFGDMILLDTVSGKVVAGKLIPAPSDFVSGRKGRFAVRNYDDIGLWMGDDYVTLPASDCLGESENNALLNFSPSGDILVTGVKCGEQVQLWNLTEEINPDKPSIVLDTENLIWRVSFSPDESRVVTNEDGGSDQVWDTRTGEHVLDLEGEASSVQFSADGERLHGYDMEQNQVLWDASSGKRIITLPNAAILNADWSRAAYWVDNTIVGVIETKTGKTINLSMIDDYMGTLGAFSGDAGKVIIINDTIRGYDLQTGEVFWQPEDGYFGAFSQGGKYFLTRSASADNIDNTAWAVWETEHPEHPLHRFEIPSSREFILSADGKFIAELYGACGDGGGGYYQLWDTATGEQVIELYPGGSCGPYAHVFSPDMKWVIVGWDYGIDILNIADAVKSAASTDSNALSSAYIHVPLYGKIYTTILGLKISRDGKQLAARVRFSDLEHSMEPVITYEIDIFNFQGLLEQGYQFNADAENHVAIPDVQKVQFSPNSAYVLTDNGLYDAATGERLASVAGAMAAFSPDSKILATVGKDGVQIWDVGALAQGKTIPLATFDVQRVQEVAFNPDGKMLYIRRVGDVQVWGIPPAS